jgi:hypothetical protein
MSAEIVDFTARLEAKKQRAMAKAIIDQMALDDVVYLPQIDWCLPCDCDSSGYTVQVTGGMETAWGSTQPPK